MELSPVRFNEDVLDYIDEGTNEDGEYMIDNVWTPRNRLAQSFSATDSGTSCLDYESDSELDDYDEFSNNNANPNVSYDANANPTPDFELKLAPLADEETLDNEIIDAVTSKRKRSQESFSDYDEKKRFKWQLDEDDAMEC
ncbi:unnamed protein product [Bursaphelenchus okinawaensis]|uniref:Uncharacterized protein n=1 Tax=Bursaphelenchus okinawaensis TaxID=465554 RepID=A0A811KGQ5_9BILA|nr:unnamed protein product [Bursaphelenchus okinawaensis]CAG9101941.1 unnamed protein product [Bursaphelenchus okinawaensis]